MIAHSSLSDAAVWARRRFQLPAALIPLAIAGCWAFPGCRSIDEPKNLSVIKNELGAYAKSSYLQQLDQIGVVCCEWIEKRIHSRSRSDRLIIVFDLDETLISNQEYFDAVDYGYTSESWLNWTVKGAAPAIESTKRIFRFARDHGIEVAIITGRREGTRSGVVKNLEAIGCSDYSILICRPDNDKGSVIPFKAGEREKITNGGMKIIANIGDQQSDLAGGYAEKTFKIPNPFYFVR